MYDSPSLSILLSDRRQKRERPAWTLKCRKKKDRECIQKELGWSQQWKVGSKCLAPFSDGQCYLAIVEKLLGGELVRVRYFESNQIGEIECTKLKCIDSNAGDRDLAKPGAEIAEFHHTTNKKTLDHGTKSANSSSAPSATTRIDQEQGIKINAEDTSCMYKEVKTAVSQEQQLPCGKISTSKQKKMASPKKVHPTGQSETVVVKTSIEDELKQIGEIDYVKCGKFSQHVGMLHTSSKFVVSDHNFGWQDQPELPVEVSATASDLDHHRHPISANDSKTTKGDLFTSSPSCEIISQGQCADNLSNNPPTTEEKAPKSTVAQQRDTQSGWKNFWQTIGEVFTNPASSVAATSVKTPTHQSSIALPPPAPVVERTFLTKNDEQMDRAHARAEILFTEQV